MGMLFSVPTHLHGWRPRPGQWGWFSSFECEPIHLDTSWNNCLIIDVKPSKHIYLLPFFHILTVKCSFFQFDSIVLTGPYILLQIFWFLRPRVPQAGVLRNGSSLKHEIHVSHSLLCTSLYLQVWRTNKLTQRYYFIRSLSPKNISAPILWEEKEEKVTC